MLIQTDTQYKEFGQEIKRLGELLEDIVAKAEEVTYDDGPPIFGQATPKWNLSPLLDVCGDFKGTLEKCKEVLVEHISSSRDRGFLSPIISIRWNMTIRPVVERLREKVAIHNRKASRCLSLRTLSSKIGGDARFHGYLASIPEPGRSLPFFAPLMLKYPAADNNYLSRSSSL